VGCEAFSIGCRANQYEAEAIKEALLAIDGEFVLLNTCAVTEEAERKSLKALRRIFRKYPSATIIVTGCLVEYKPQLFEHPFIVAVPNGEKMNIPTLFGAPPAKRITHFFEHSRALIKVADGCPHTCSFCIVTHLRGDLRSRSVEDILEEAKTLAENGYKEVVLTAINLGAFGRDRNTDLATLVKRLDEENIFPRIRLSSLEPHQITEDFLNAIGECEHICPHFHIPLQSGSTRILNRMRRPYSPHKFLSIVERLRKMFDRPAITTDIIVGFPSETEDDFNATLRVAEEAGFCRIHIFPFSPREGTEAAGLPHRITPDVLKERASRLRNLAAELAAEYRRSLVGMEETVIIEENREKHSIGITERYQRALLENISIPCGEYLRIKITSPVEPPSDILLAEPLRHPSPDRND